MNKEKFLYKLSWIDSEEKRNLLITENHMEALAKYSEVANSNYQGIVLVRDIYDKIKEDM